MSSKQIKDYKNHIMDFKSMLDGIKTSNHKFSTKQLCQIFAHNVTNYLMKKPIPP